MNYEMPRSGVGGVVWVRCTKKWQAKIGIDGKSKSLGCFKDLDEAVIARYKAEQIFHKGMYLDKSLAEKYLIKKGLI